MSTEALSDVGVPKGSAESGDGTAWSLASLWLGAVALLTGPLMMIYLLLAWNLGPKRAPRMDAPDEMVSAILSILSTIVMLALAVRGILFGLKGRRIYQGHHEPHPLASAGILMGTTAGMGWIIVGIALLFMLNAR
jgi:hypothetical protein